MLVAREDGLRPLSLPCFEQFSVAWHLSGGSDDVIGFDLQSIDLTSEFVEKIAIVIELCDDVVHFAQVEQTRMKIVGIVDDLTIAAQSRQNVFSAPCSSRTKFTSSVASFHRDHRSSPRWNLRQWHPIGLLAAPTMHWHS